MNLMRTIGIVAAILGVAVAFPAAGVTVNYTVGGTGSMQFPAETLPPAGAPWGEDGYPGDTVELQGYTGTLELTPGTYYQKINTLLWIIDYTYGGTETCWDYPDCWSELDFAVNAPRSITIHTSNGTVSQTGSLECLWDNDYLQFAAGTEVSFSVLDYTVFVTPLAVERHGAFWGSANTAASDPSKAPMCDLPCYQPELDVMAKFVVEKTVPVEPTTWSRVKALYR